MGEKNSTASKLPPFPFLLSPFPFLKRVVNPYVRPQ